MQDARMVLNRTRVTIAKTIRRGELLSGHRFRWLFVLVGLAMTGCDFPGRPNDRQIPVPAEQNLSFDALYVRNCAGCHGADGRLGPAPPLNDPLFVAIVPDNVLHSVIRDGRTGTLMPAFAQEKGGTLSDAQVQVLASGIKSRWRPARSASGDLPPYSVPTRAKHGSSAVSIQRGAAAFARGCAGCHGAKGEGDSAGAISDSAFLALISDQALRRVIITGRPDLGMPNYAQTDGRSDDFKPLTSAEINDLIAFMRHAGKQAAATAQSDHSTHAGLIAPMVTAASEASN
jgi:mono/diheme cytochrome c family protein